MNNYIKILGASGSKSKDCSMTCIQTDESTVLDAGNILLSLGDKSRKIENIVLTHSHMDHIVDIPFLIDVYFSDRINSLNIYGTKETIEDLKEYIFNWKIWPDFSKIELENGKKSIVFKEIKINQEFRINTKTYKAIKTNHTNGSCGYVISDKDSSILFTSDTGPCDEIWEEINKNKTIKSLIIDVSFPSKLEKLAIDSKHLTLKLLKEELKKLERKDIIVYINHLKPSHIKEIEEELKKEEYKNILNTGCILKENDEILISELKVIRKEKVEEKNKRYIEKLIEIGHSLTSENNKDLLMEKILESAKELSNSDGGTLYLFNEIEKSLSFKFVQTDSLNIKMGGSFSKITWSDVKLYKENGEKNTEQVAALCALNNELINISDVYKTKKFNFEGTKRFDKGTGYRTKSMIVIPMKNHENDIIGVLQLLNKKDENGRICEYNKNDEKLILSMSSQAAISLTNIELIKDLEKLLFEFIKSTADAISEKSKYTGGHISRVAELSTLIANEINKDNKYFSDVSFTDDELKQIDISAWMHDIGKITTPEYIIDKATKLETKYDRINEVIMKAEIIKRDLEINFLKQQLKNNTSVSDKEKYEKEIQEIDNSIILIKKLNKGSEFVKNSELEKLKELSEKYIKVNNRKLSFLTKDELYNLSIKKGTLNEEERKIINNHVVVSYNMLKKLTFPKKLKRVPIIAGSHHKKIKKDKNGIYDGYGAKEIMDLPMSVEDKILAVADVFEAITASDRPYKSPNTLNQSFEIMKKMVENKELDRDIVKFFIEKEIYKDYVENNLLDKQKDEVNIIID